MIWILFVIIAKYWFLWFVVFKKPLACQVLEGGSSCSRQASESIDSGQSYLWLSIGQNCFVFNVISKEQLFPLKLFKNHTWYILRFTYAAYRKLRDALSSAAEPPQGLWSRDPLNARCQSAHVHDHVHAPTDAEAHVEAHATWTWT